jgi:polyisoprenoid-binding protein YceI
MRCALCSVLLVLITNPLGAAVRFAVIAEKSTIAARTDKRGLLSAFGGHKHGIIATQFAGALCADPATLQDASVVISVPAAGLRIDTPEARRAASLPSSGPGAKDVPAIQQKMLSPGNLAAGEHPALRFESTAADRKGDTLLVRGRLTIRGRTSSVAVPLHIERSGGTYRFSGTFSVRQTDYGMRPESIGGVVSVADPVTVVLDIVARPTQEACR